MKLFRSSERRDPEVVASERRVYRRVQAPISVRPVGFFEQTLPRAVSDVSQGGLRAYSDERHRVGERVELELFLPEGPPIVVTVEVVWIDALPKDGPARFDVGMRYLSIRPEDLARVVALFPRDA